MSPTPTPSTTTAPATHAPSTGAAPVARGLCPECDAAVPFGRAPLSGQVLPCPGCGAELEVTSRDPLTLQLAPEVEEDWGE